MEKNILFEKATLAAGCFWCTEAIFKRLKGVITVIPGYTGGIRDNPTYTDVSTGMTNHAEAIQITFDPSIITYDAILDVFWHTHNPTTLNQQGADKGTQYRSAIFYHTPAQKQIAFQSKKLLEQSKAYHEPIVTEIISFNRFYPAEDYHKNYYEKNQSYDSYCQIIINPKIKKLLVQYGQVVKDEYQENKNP